MRLTIVFHDDGFRPDIDHCFRLLDRDIKVGFFTCFIVIRTFRIIVNAIGSGILGCRDEEGVITTLISLVLHLAGRTDSRFNQLLVFAIVSQIFGNRRFVNLTRCFRNCPG